MPLKVMNLKVIESRLNFIEGHLASEKEKNDKENVPMNKTREFDSTVKIPPIKVDYEEYKKKSKEIEYNPVPKALQCSRVLNN